MKSDLTKKDIASMYNSKNPKKQKKVEKTESVRTFSSRDMVIVENNGQKHILPSNFAFKKLLNEHETVKNDLKQAQGEIKLLREAVGRLIQNANQLQESLNDKVDRPDI